VRRARQPLALVAGALVLAATAAARDPAARPRPTGHAAAAGAASRHGAAVAGEHRAAASAGAEILRAGGSAADAAIAAAAAGCVVHPASCGVGGGGFALVRPARGPAVALDFRETAPQRGTPDRFVDADGTPRPERLRQGGLAVATPGEVAGWVALHRRFGRLPMKAVLAPAIRLARDGFALAEAPALRRQIEANAGLLRADAGLAAVFLDAGGALPGPAFRVVQADLACTLEAVARAGVRAVYAGATAEAIVRAVGSRGGVLQLDDLARYRPRWRTPLIRRFRGREVIAFPPPGGGATVLTALGVLSRDDPVALGAGTATWLHLLAGAMAQAFADRARWYGDPAATPVPVDALLAPPRLARLRAGLRATARAEPDPALAAAAGGGTANVSVLDAEGGAVALTTTINGPFGAGILVPGTGIVLNDEMDDFAVAPGVANAYGLVGTAANAVAPGKRPQSSMSPTVVVRDGRPELVVGGSGGPAIVSGVLQVVLGVTAFGLDAPGAVAAPRIHDQAVPPGLAVEPGIDATARAALTRVGHRLREATALGAVSAVAVAADGTLTAAGDARKDGGAVLLALPDPRPPARPSGSP